MIPFENCWARPPEEGGRTHYLSKHLLEVAFYMGNPAGWQPEPFLYLAGVLHDAGKAHWRWQNYIRNPQEAKSDRIPHSYAGAILFALCAQEWIPEWAHSKIDKENLCWLAIILTQAIYGHHGEWADIDSDFPPWQANHSYEELSGIDLNGLSDFLSQQFPLFSNLLDCWSRDKFLKFPETWTRWRNAFLHTVSRESKNRNIFAVSASLYMKANTVCGSLIEADRRSAAKVPVSPQEFLQPEDAGQALNAIDNYIQNRTNELLALKANHTLQEMREKCRLEGMERFKREGHKSRILTVELPTGYGKTLTSLSIALTAVRLGLAKRIIYVAPFISILSQAAREIERATNQKVLLSHHLSALDFPFGEESEEEKLFSDLWNFPVIATTYNQLFRTLFPLTEQNSMRINGIRDAFLIIDEPQAIGAISWNPFLSALEALTANNNCIVLFSTATIPILESGLFETSYVNLVSAAPVLNRYRVQYIGKMNEVALVAKLIERFKIQPNLAVILNTIADAAYVFKELKNKLPKQDISRLRFLSGRMTPIHKAAKITNIRESLQKGEKILLVSTQAIEAGVDLSFSELWRALPILPSIIQSAGRCNRHGESEQGQVFVFNYCRSNNKESRAWIYKESYRREVTDKLVQPPFDERDSIRLIKEYYYEVAKRNAETGSLNFLLKAANGYWSRISQLEPFEDDDLYESGLFVTSRAVPLPRTIVQNMRYFGASTPEDLWNLYIKQSWLRGFSFNQRRRFMALMNQFVVAIPEKLMSQIGECAPKRNIAKLRYDEYYNLQTGLSLLETEKAVSDQFV